MHINLEKEYLVFYLTFVKNKGPIGSKEQLEELGKEGKTEDNNYFIDDGI